MKKRLLLALLIAALGRSLYAQTPPGGYSSPVLGSSSSLSTSVGGPNNINPLSSPFNGSGNVKILLDCVFTNGQPTVSCPDGTFTQANVGYLVEATNNTGDTNGLTSVYIIPASTTILSVQSATGITLSANASATTPGGASSSVLAYGLQDDSAALNSAWIATVAACPASLNIPAGAYFISTALFNQTAAKCQVANSVTTSLSIGGVGLTVPILIPRRSFASAGCTGGVSGAACLFGSQGITVQNIEVWGLGASAIGAGFNGKNAVEINGGTQLGNSIVTNMQLLGWGAATAGFTGLLADSASGITLSIMRLDGMGSIGCQLNVPVGTFIEISNSYCANAGTNPLNAQVSGRLFSKLGIYGSTLTSAVAASSILNASATGEIWSDGDAFDYTTGTGTGQVQAIGNVHFSNDSIGNPGSVNGFGLVGGNGTLASKIWLNNTRFNIAGTAPTCIIGNNGGVAFFDLGGNSFLGGTNCTTGYTANGSTFFGSASATGTAFSTASFALTSGWGASTKASAAGDSQSFNFVITGAVGGAGPVVTVTFPTPFQTAPAQCTITQTSGTFAVLTNPVISSISATGFLITWSGTPAANTYGFSGWCK